MAGRQRETEERQNDVMSIYKAKKLFEKFTKMQFFVNFSVVK